MKNTFANAYVFKKNPTFYILHVYVSKTSDKLKLNPLRLY